MYCENEKGKRVDLSSKEYASCAGGKCGGWKWVKAGCAPWNSGCHRSPGAWLPAAEVCRLNLHAKFDKRIKPSGSSSSSSSSRLSSSSSSGSSSSSSRISSSSSSSSSSVIPLSSSSSSIVNLYGACCSDGNCFLFDGDNYSLGWLLCDQSSWYDGQTCEQVTCLSPSIPAPSKQIRSGDYTCPNPCPSGCCDEEGWICCPGGAYCAATPEDCPTSALGVLAVKSKSLFDPTVCEGTECPAGCCPGENWFCCPDNIYCASTAEYCPSAAAEIIGEPTTIAGVAFDPSDYFDTSLLPMRFISGTTAGEFVVPEWLGFNRAVYINSQGNITNQYIAPRQIIRFQSTIVLGYDPDGYRGPTPPPPPEFTVSENIGNVEVGPVYKVSVTPVSGATGYVFRFNGVAIRPTYIGPQVASNALPEGLPAIGENEYLYNEDLDGYAMTAASTNRQGTGSFSEPTQIGEKPCDVDADCGEGQCCVDGKCGACPRTGSWCTGTIACDGKFYIDGCATGTLDQWIEGDNANTVQGFSEGGSCTPSPCSIEEKPECCGNEDCKGCEQCVDGKCASDCSDAQYCCQGATCCALDECCEDNVCRPCPCDQGQSCPSGQTCCNGVCTGGKCCDLDSECDASKCEKCMETFSGTRECMPNCPEDVCCEGDCKDGKCCKSSSECEACEECVDGACKTMCDASLCQRCVDGECKGCDVSQCEICDEGTCDAGDGDYKCCPDGRRAECCSDEDCGGCEFCNNNGFCSYTCDSCEKCESDVCVAKCPEGKRCGDFAEGCVIGQRCEIGLYSDCPPEYPFCCYSFASGDSNCQPVPCCGEEEFFTDCGGEPRCLAKCKIGVGSVTTLNPETCECECKAAVPLCFGIESYSFDEDKCECGCSNGLNYEICEERNLPLLYDGLVCRCDCDYKEGRISCPSAAWDDVLCECDCAKAYSPCPSPLEFDHMCQCKCPSTEACATEALWNPETCLCESVCSAGQEAYRCNDTNPPTIGCANCDEGKYLGSCGEQDDLGVAVPGVRFCKTCAIVSSDCSEGTQLNTAKCRCEPTCAGGKQLNEETLSCECSELTYWDGSSCSSCEGNKVPNSSGDGCECRNTQSQYWNGSSCVFCELLQQQVSGYTDEGERFYFDDSCQAVNQTLLFDGAHCECVGGSSSSSSSSSGFPCYPDQCLNDGVCGDCATKWAYGIVNCPDGSEIFRCRPDELGPANSIEECQDLQGVGYEDGECPCDNGETCEDGTCCDFLSGYCTTGGESSPSICCPDGRECWREEDGEAIIYCCPDGQTCSDGKCVDVGSSSSSKYPPLPPSP